MAFYTIRPKSGTATQWSTANPVLREREIGFEYPDGGLGTGEIKMKMGDGVTAWNDLEYAILPLYIRDGIGNAVYDLPITPQPNMLINADFEHGIINQRGKTEYDNTSGSGYVYCIDRWKNRKHQKMTVEDGFIRFTKTQASDHLLMQQFVDIQAKNAPEKLTYTMKTRASTPMKFHLYQTDKYYDIGTDWTILSITFDRTEIADWETENVHVYLGGVPQGGLEENVEVGTYIDVAWAKLEAGEVFTGMPIFNKNEELQKCLPYFIKKGSIKLIATNASGNYFYIVNGGLPCIMRKTPSITYDSATTNSGTEINNKTFSFANRVQKDSISSCYCAEGTTDISGYDPSLKYDYIYLSGVSIDAEM